MSSSQRTPRRALFALALVPAAARLFRHATHATAAPLRETLPVRATLVGQIGGGLGPAARHGHRLVASVGPRLALFDLIDPARPALLGQSSLSADVVEAIAAVATADDTDDLALAAAGRAGVLVHRLTDAGDVVPLGAAPPLAGTVRSLALDRGHAFVVEEPAGGGRPAGFVRVLDLAAPARPVDVGRFDPPAGAGVFDAVAAGGRLYLSCSDGLRVLDVSVPATPQVTAHVPPPAPAIPYRGMQLDGAVLYFIRQAGRATLTLHVYDVSDPSAPAPLAALSGQYGSLAVSAGRLCAARVGRLDVFDVSDPASPVEVARFPVSSETSLRVGAALDGVVVLLQADALRVLDVSAAAAPREIGRYAAGETPRGEAVAPFSASSLAVRGDRAYVAASYSAVHTVGVADPARPRLLGTVPMAEQINGVATVGDHLYVWLARRAQGDSGLEIFDATADPPRRAARPASGPGTALPHPPNVTAAVAGGRLYASAWPPGVVAVDVTDPTHPVELGYAPIPDVRSVQYVRVLGQVEGVGQPGTPPSPTHVVATVVPGGPLVLDVSDPAAPRVVASLAGADRPGLPSLAPTAVVGSSLYVCDAFGLRAFDLSDPTAPVLTAFHRDVRGTFGAVDGNRLFVQPVTQSPRILRAYEVDGAEVRDLGPLWAVDSLETISIGAASAGLLALSGNRQLGVRLFHIAVS